MFWIWSCMMFTFYQTLFVWYRKGWICYLGTLTLLAQSSCVWPVWELFRFFRIRVIRWWWLRDWSEGRKKGDRRFPGKATAVRRNFLILHSKVRNSELRRREVSKSSTADGNLHKWKITLLVTFGNNKNVCNFIIKDSKLLSWVQRNCLTLP